MDKLLKQIKNLREDKNKEQETFELIKKAKKIAEEKNDVNSLAELFWEESLTWQHLVMNQATKDDQNEKTVSSAKQNMETAALEAHEIITSNNIIEKLGISYRFLGRVCDYNNNFKTAYDYYIKGVSIIKKQEDAKQVLELQGFMSYDLVMMGNTKRGIDLAKKTFESFINSDVGKKLKKTDYVTWAIWISGIFPRIINALIQTESKNYNYKELRLYLKMSEDFLLNPKGKLTWGGQDIFSYRISEHKKTRELLVNLVNIIIVFVSSSAQKFL